MEPTRTITSDGWYYRKGVDQSGRLVWPFPETRQYKGQRIEMMADCMLTSSKHTVQELGYALKGAYHACVNY